MLVNISHAVHQYRRHLIVHNITMDSNPTTCTDPCKFIEVFSKLTNQLLAPPYDLHRPIDHISKLVRFTFEIPRIQKKLQFPNFHTILLAVFHYSNQCFPNPKLLAKSKTSRLRNSKLETMPDDFARFRFALHGIYLTPRRYFKTLPDDNLANFIEVYLRYKIPLITFLRHYGASVKTV